MFLLQYAKDIFSGLKVGHSYDFFKLYYKTNKYYLFLDAYFIFQPFPFLIFKENSRYLPLLPTILNKSFLKTEIMSLKDG